MSVDRSLLNLLFVSLFVPSVLQAQDPVELELVPWAQGLAAAVDVTHAGDSRLFVVRQWGAITIVLDSMTVAPQQFINLTDRVLYGGERGLLGMAFDPDYATNGFFYVNYVTGTGNGISRISRFSVMAGDPNVADPTSEVLLLSLPQPDPIHQGGGLVFGNDGYLYVAFGDGGGSSDPNSFGQNATNLFGTILRIKPEPDSTYSIPPDNPFVGSPNGEREEIWAYGLRNPYRIGIDPLSGDLWVGDVGQQLWEEINHMPGGDNSGPNFGWSCYEGNEPFNLAGCGSIEGLQFPVTVQAHSINGGNFCAIVAGEVYRGTRYPRMYGRFFYTDYCTGGVRTLTDDGHGGYTDQLAVAVPFPGMSSIGANLEGELFLTNVSNGRVYKIKDKCPMDPPSILPDGNNLSTAEGASYEWTIDGDPVPGGDEQTIFAFVSGYYTVRVTYANGCVKTSEAYFHLATGLSTVGSSSIRSYPQPAAGLLNIERAEEQTDRWTISLTDVSGRVLVVRNWAEGATRTTVDVSGVPSGPCVLELRDARGTPVHRSMVAIAR